MDSILKPAISVQKMIYRVEESIADTESFQIIYFLLWVFYNRLEEYVPRTESKYLKDTWTSDGLFNSINSIVNK